MTKNIWSIPCKKAIVDDQTKLVSIIDVVEKIIFDIDLNKAPVELKTSFKNGEFSNPINIPDEIVIASYWAIGEEDREKDMILITEIEDPNQTKLGEGILEFRTIKGNSNHRTFVRIPSFAVTKNGLYTIISNLKGKDGKNLAKSVAQISVEINSVVIE